MKLFAPFKVSYNWLPYPYTKSKTFSLTLSRLGGHFLHGSPKIVCRVHVDCATLTKFLDFVSFDVRHVPSLKNFFEKFQNFTHRQRGDPSKNWIRAESAPPVYNLIPEPSPDRVKSVFCSSLNWNWGNGFSSLRCVIFIFLGRGTLIPTIIPFCLRYQTWLDSWPSVEF